MVDSGADDEAAPTELPGMEEMVIVLCIVVVRVLTVVNVRVEVLLPEVTTVLSVQVVFC
jgi:hypothetical protein